MVLETDTLSAFLPPTFSQSVLVYPLSPVWTTFFGRVTTGRIDIPLLPGEDHAVVYTSCTAISGFGHPAITKTPNKIANPPKIFLSIFYHLLLFSFYINLFRGLILGLKYMHYMILMLRKILSYKLFYLLFE
jgi:hypothetical protein